MGANIALAKLYERPIEEETTRVVRNIMKGAEKGATRVESVDYCTYYAHGECVMHVHDEAEEIFCFLRGEGVFQLGDEEIPFSPGTLINVPRGVPHGFKNTTDGIIEHVVCSISLA